MYEIDRNRRNNLVFYGVRSGGDEGGEECAERIRNLFNTYLQVALLFLTILRRSTNLIVIR